MRFNTKERPISTPSIKSETEKPETSKCKNRPTRIPRDNDIIPNVKIFLSLSSI
jgi:hypothetical protein